MYSTEPGPDRGSLIARALASEYPFDTRFRDLSDHPSIRSRYTEIGASFEGNVSGIDEAIILRMIHRDARKRLRNRKVVHFEVVIKEHGCAWFAVVEKREDPDVEE